MNLDDSVGFRWTGHPFIDFGVATLMAKAGLTNEEDQPQQLTVKMVTDFAKEALPTYFLEPDLFKSVVMCFPNIMNLNPKVLKEKRETEIRNFLEGFTRQVDPTLSRCPFFDRPSVGIVSRKSYPLLMGDTQINYYPGGQLGLPVSGQAMTATQAVVFGALRSQGKLMVFAADDKRLLRDVVREWSMEIEKRIHLSEQSKETIDIAPPKTALVGTLIRLLSRHKELDEAEKDEEGYYLPETGKALYFGGATLYHFSNSGQGPSLTLYQIGAPVLEFIQAAQSAGYEAAWAEIRRRWWPKPKGTKKGATTAIGEPDLTQFPSQSNSFYNSLLGLADSLPNGGQSFVKTYFVNTMRDLIQQAASDNLRTQFSRDAKIRQLWKLTELFLREVLSLDVKRIETIRKLGDRLADVVESDPGRYKQFFLLRRNDWNRARQLLNQLNQREIAQGHEMVIQMDDFLTVFELYEDVEYPDWLLAWDVVIMRMMEGLYQRNFFKSHPEAIATLPETDEQPSMAEPKPEETTL